MKEYTIPLIIRGRVIEDHLVRFEARRGVIAFHAPDVCAYFDDIVLRDPAGLSDLYSISLDEIIGYLADLGTRLSPDANAHVARAIDMGILTSGLSAGALRGMYCAMAANLNARFLREVVEQNIGSRFLEGWDKRSLDECEVSIRAFGSRTVHLNAGNGPAVALFGLINGSLLRCDNIIKSPSNDPFTAVAIALTMIEMAPDHPLTKHMTVAYWKGGDVAFEKRLYQPNVIDKIVAWGGQSSMDSIRGYLQPGLDLIALDPKISASIIGSEALATDESMDQTAERLARDFGYFNQEGCVSARIAYVASGTDAEGVQRLDTLGKKVFAALKNLPAHLSTPHPAFDPILREEIEGIRYSDGYRVIGCKGNDGGVIVSQNNEPVDFRDRLACRVINLVPIDDVAEAIAYLTVHTQTVGVYPNDLKIAIRDRCLLQGVQRLTDLGCATFEGMAYPHDGLELMRRMARWGVMESFQPSIVKQGAGLAHTKV